MQGITGGIAVGMFSWVFCHASDCHFSLQFKCYNRPWAERMCNYSSKLFFNTPVNFTCHLHKMNISGWAATSAASHPSCFLQHLHILELTVEEIMQDTPHRPEQKYGQFWKVSQFWKVLQSSLILEKPQHPRSTRSETVALEYVAMKSAALSRKVIAHQKLTMPYSTWEERPRITNLPVQVANHQCCWDYLLITSHRFALEFPLNSRNSCCLTSVFSRSKGTCTLP